LSFVAAGYLFGHAMSRVPHHAGLAVLATVVIATATAALVMQRRRLARAAG
jgi:hypothetical protein